MIEYEIKQYVSELGDEILLNRDKVILDAPTNSGKTRYVINCMKKTEDRFVYYADTLILAQQTAYQYGLTFHSADNPAPNGEKWISTVYNHYPKFTSEGYSTTIEDEFHTSVSDYGYKNEIIDNVEAFSKYNTTRILLSGTPLEYPKDFEHIKIIKSKPQEHKINVITDFNVNGDNYRNDVFLGEVLTAINSGKQVWISLFDKSKDLPLLIQSLIKNEVPRNKIAMINADTKDGDAFTQLVEKNKIDNYQVIFTTFVQGFNITGNCDDYKLIILPNPRAKHSWADVIQIYNRFRDNQGNLESVLLWNNFPGKINKLVFELEREEFYKNEKLYETEMERLKQFHYSFAQAKEGTFDPKISEWVINEYKLGLVKVDLKVNTKKMKYNVYKKITDMMWTDFEIMKELLSRGGITLEKIESNFCEFKHLDEEELAELKKLSEDRILQKNKLVLEKLNCLDDLSFSSPYYFPLKELFELTNDFELSKQKIIENFGNKRKMNKLIDEIRLKYSKDIGSKLYRKLIFETFEDGNSYSNNEILDKMQSIAIEIDNNQDITTSNQAVRTLKKFFEVKRKTIEW